MHARAELGDLAADPPVPDDDAALLAGSDADPDAFGRLHRRHAEQLLRWAHRRAGSADVALDLVAETFAVAYEQRHRFDPARGTVGGWLQGILRTELARVRRRRAVELRAVRRLGVLVPEPDARSVEALESIADRVDAGRHRAELRTALAGLSGRDRDVIQLRVLEQLDHQQVADRLGCSVAAARVRCHRALGRLAARMPQPEETR